jgi:ADP-dependent NAD(P)H-hydrate dehydratase / NAD(P)H-hydrate epimerase
MNIFNRTQIKAWDGYTISHEPVESIDLMERAAGKLYDWISAKFPFENDFIFFCGTGNNGGDGLALARLMRKRGANILVYLSDKGSLSADCRTNLDRLKELEVPVKILPEPDQLPEIPGTALLIDALFGTGLTRPLEGPVAELVYFLNSLSNTIISIDVPSGLPADALAANDAVVQAHYTLTFQCPKFSFFLPEHDVFVGEWHVLDIGLLPVFEEAERTPYAYIDQQLVDTFKPQARSRHAHKGQFGHAVLMGGSRGMAGAVVMAAAACLRSGVGLLTTGVHDEGFPVMQSSVPEAMCFPQSLWMNHHFYHGKSGLGVGMGWVNDDFHGKLLQWLICNFEAPLLIDATALNILSANKEWLEMRPKGAATILTPHIGEFNRLTGKSLNSVERMQKAKELASQYQVLVVLKGAYTQVITPGGLVYFNGTGNPGMARGGSGDILAGLITGLLAQGMVPTFACLLGVYLHGLAGDLAATQKSQPGMTAMDIVNFIPEAWRKILNEPGHYL